ncbi:MAG TPA: single-stranded DNA-binding protein [Catalimonadaceae bacterium]|nr:single-stranded DNA-binding protein [Catalimonadaceae bacterium]
MRGLNKVTLIGNLGKNPEIQQLEGGITLAKFTLATSESYRDEKGNKHTDTEWHSILAWRNLAEVARKYLKKGSTIYLEGKIKTRSYEDKTGVKKQVTEIIADHIIMLDKPSGSASDTTDIYATQDRVA